MSKKFSKFSWTTSARKLENVVADAKLKKGRKLATKDSSIEIFRNYDFCKNNILIINLIFIWKETWNWDIGASNQSSKIPFLRNELSKIGSNNLKSYVINFLENFLSLFYFLTYFEL